MTISAGGRPAGCPKPSFAGGQLLAASGSLRVGRAVRGTSEGPAPAGGHVGVRQARGRGRPGPLEGRAVLYVGGVRMPECGNRMLLDFGPRDNPAVGSQPRPSREPPRRRRNVGHQCASVEPVGGVGGGVKAQYGVVFQEGSALFVTENSVLQNHTFVELEVMQGPCVEGKGGSVVPIKSTICSFAAATPTARCTLFTLRGEGCHRTPLNPSTSVSSEQPHVNKWPSEVTMAV